MIGTRPTDISIRRRKRGYKTSRFRPITLGTCDKCGSLRVPLGYFKVYSNEVENSSLNCWFCQDCYSFMSNLYYIENGIL